MNQDKLYVGIDVSSKNNVCYLMYSDGSKHSSFSVPNNRNGAKIIVDRVTSVLLLQDIPQVVIGMEATSVYGDNLMRFLRESGSLGRFERSLHMLNPKQVKKYCQIAQLLGLRNFNTITTVRSLISWVEFMMKEMDIPLCVSELGVCTQEEYFSKIPEMAEAAMLDSCTRTNPKRPEKEDLEKILVEAW